MCVRQSFQPVGGWWFVDTTEQQERTLRENCSCCCRCCLEHLRVSLYCILTYLLLREGWGGLWQGAFFRRGGMLIFLVFVSFDENIC